MKVGALDHPKTKGLKARLQCSRAQVIGHLELLWAFAAQHAAQGDIGKWGDEEIAEACDWQEHGERGPQFFVQALTEKGFLDRSDVHRLIVHDWPEHAPRWVSAKLHKEGLPFISVPTTAPSIGATTDASIEASTGRHTEAASSSKGYQAKGNQGSKSKSAVALPAWVNAEAWAAWEAYRRECRKALTPSTITKQLKFLEAHKQDHVAIIDQSIRNGWQGLFELKDAHGNHGKSGGKSAPDRVADANRKYQQA